VRWDDGHETVFVPGSDCRVISDDNAAPMRFGCHIDVSVVEDDDDCRAMVSVITSRGVLRADGVARRRRTDPEIPMVGEELALGRALGALAEQLVSAATAHLADPPSPQTHLLA